MNELCAVTDNVTMQTLTEAGKKKPQCDVIHDLFLKTE